MKMEAFGVMIPGLPFFFMLLLLIDLFDMIMNSKRNMNK